MGYLVGTPLTGGSAGLRWLLLGENGSGNHVYGLFYIDTCTILSGYVPRQGYYKEDKEEGFHVFTRNVDTETAGARSRCLN